MRSIELRREAFEACGKMQWQSCVDKLDEAARADPDGDKNPEVQSARAFAKKQLASQRCGEGGSASHQSTLM
jgi:hypothetical protein